MTVKSYWEQLRRDITKKAKMELIKEMEMAQYQRPKFIPNNGAIVIRRQEK